MALVSAKISQPSARSSARSGRSSVGSRRSRGRALSDIAHDEPEITESVLLRLRTAVGNGSELVDLGGNEVNQLGDDEVKVLIRMISDMEASAKARVLAADNAKLALMRAREGDVLPDYNAFNLDHSKDDAAEEKLWDAACRVVWDDDPIEYAEGKEMVDEDDGRPLSYRFTPRSQRASQMSYSDGVAVGGGARRATAGRAKILFRTAIARYNRQQQGLLFEAAAATLAVEEAGTGCQHLSLQHNSFGSRGCAHLGALVRSSNTLQTLALGCNPIGDAGAALIGRALPHSRVLVTLALQDCAITAQGVRHLATGVGRNSSLRSLWLFANAAADEGAAHLAAALRTSKLQHLGLEMNDVSKLGAEALSYALSFGGCHLAWLRLQHNPIGDDGVAALARSIYSNRTLTKLQLRDVQVRERGVAELAKAIPHNMALQSIGLEENYLPPSATESLLRAMRQSPSLKSVALDLQHGGDYTKERTAKEMMAEFALVMLGGSKIGRALAKARGQATGAPSAVAATCAPRTSTPATATPAAASKPKLWESGAQT